MACEQLGGASVVRHSRGGYTHVATRYRYSRVIQRVKAIYSNNIFSIRGRNQVALGVNDYAVTMAFPITYLDNRVPLGCASAMLKANREALLSVGRSAREADIYP